MDLGLSINPLATADAIFDFSGTRKNQIRSMELQDQYNQISSRLNREKFDFAKAQDRRAREREDNRIQRLVADANKAGVSVSTALGAAGSAPASISIPGHSNQRVMSNAYSNPFQNTAQLSSELKRQTEKQKIDDYNDSLFQSHRQQREFYEFKKAQAEYNTMTSGSPLPKKYDLYDDNTQEAIRHIENGGFVVPAGASMELPESIGAYHFAKPYVKPSDNFLQKVRSNIDTGIAP